MQTVKQRNNYCLVCVIQKYRGVFTVACVHNFLQRERRLPSQREVFISLPPYSPIHLLSPPVRLSAHQEIGADSCLCVRVSVCVCVLPDVPCSVAHLLNVTDHSLFHLITPIPLPSAISLRHHPYHPSISCSSAAALLPHLLPPLRPPARDLHSPDPMHPRHNSLRHARLREYTQALTCDDMMRCFAVTT